MDILAGCGWKRPPYKAGLFVEVCCIIDNPRLQFKLIIFGYSAAAAATSPWELVQAYSWS